MRSGLGRLAVGSTASSLIAISGPIVIDCDYGYRSGGPVNHAHGTLSGTSTEVVETRPVWSRELMAGSF
jgi:hypothetical protein